MQPVILSNNGAVPSQTLKIMQNKLIVDWLLLFKIGFQIFLVPFVPINVFKTLYETLCLSKSSRIEPGIFEFDKNCRNVEPRLCRTATQYPVSISRENSIELISFSRNDHFHGKLYQKDSPFYLLNRKFILFVKQSSFSKMSPFKSH